jgi:hypothetical protein
MLQSKFKNTAAGYDTSPLCFGGANMDNVNKPVLSKTTEMKIGKINYIVTTHFNKNGRETAKDKLLRYVSSRVSANRESPKKAVE